MKFKTLREGYLGQLNTIIPHPNPWWSQLVHPEAEVLDSSPLTVSVVKSGERYLL